LVDVKRGKNESKFNSRATQINSHWLAERAMIVLRRRVEKNKVAWGNIKEGGELNVSVNG